jgi:hypothetical protein
MLETFVAQGLQGAKAIQAGELLMAASSIASIAASATFPMMLRMSA